MSQKILVVDDEAGIRKLLHGFFQDFGYEVAEAGSAKEALEILGKDPIPVILLDLNLPEMNGLQLCQIIREKQPSAHIFAVTGYHHSYTAEDCKKAGFDDFFVKPVNLHVLHNAVLAAFEKLSAGQKTA
jgi:CheY-like chemotaxis protein